MKKKIPSVLVAVSTRELKDIVRDELYGLQSQLWFPTLTNDMIKQASKRIVKRALLAPRPGNVE